MIFEHFTFALLGSNKNQHPQGTRGERLSVVSGVCDLFLVHPIHPLRAEEMLKNKRKQSAQNGVIPIINNNTAPNNCILTAKPHAATR